MDTGLILVLLAAFVCVQCQSYGAQIKYYPQSSSKYGFIRPHSGHIEEQVETDHSVLAAPPVDTGHPILVISPSDFIREGSSNLTLRCSPPNDPYVNTVSNLEIRRVGNGTTPSMLGSVSVGQAPALGAGLSAQNYTVTGSIESTNVTASYIQLDIINPTISDSGVYSCRYTGRDNLGTTQQQLDKNITVADRVTVRLSTERGPVEGRLEIFHNGEWRNVCDGGFLFHNAKVACRHLGYLDPKGIAIPQPLYKGHNSWFQNNGTYWLNHVSCSGKEEKFEDCGHPSWGITYCKFDEQVGVDCMYMNARLTQEDFVEVFHDNHWKAVCPPDFTIQAANVICRQLGYSDGNVIVDITVQDGMNNNPMFDYGFNCTGQEADISKCMTLKKTSSCPLTTAKRMKCLNGSLERIVSMSCANKSFNIDVDYQALRKLYPQFNESDLLLGRGCTGNLTGDRLTFNEGFERCFTRTKQIDEHTVAFTNELVYVVRSSATAITDIRWAIDLECTVSRGGSNEISFLPIESNHRHHLLGNSTQFKSHIHLYSDPLYQHKVTSSSLIVGQPVYVQVESDKATGLRMILEACYAKPDHNSTKDQSRILIDNGCEKDDNTHLTRYTDSETRFFFTTLAFPGAEALVDLHCDVRFCSSLKRSTTCRHGCHLNSAVIG